MTTTIACSRIALRITIPIAGRRSAGDQDELEPLLAVALPALDDPVVEPLEELDELEDGLDDSVFDEPEPLAEEAPDVEPLSADDPVDSLADELDPDLSDRESLR